MAVYLADRGVTVVEGTAYLTVGRRSSDFLIAFQSVRPLIVKLVLLPPRKAYQAFKFLARLQRCVGSPYLPPLQQGIPVKFEDPLVKKLSFYVIFAVGVYPRDLMNRHEIRLPKKSYSQFEDYILKRVPKTSLLAKRELSEPTKPAYLLLACPSTSEVVLAIRGSTSFSDWLTNLVCNPGTDTGHHMGMQEAAENIDLEIRLVLVNYLQKHRTYNVVLTGHSLGGGVATLLAIRWVNMLPIEFQKKVFAYSFGSPCVVSRTDAELYQERVFSVIFGRDLIARLSYGSVRDLLLTLHGLSNCKNSASPNLAEALQGESEIIEACNVIESESESDSEVDRLENEPVQPALKAFVDLSDGDTSSVTVPAIYRTGQERRRQIRADIANARLLTLPAKYRDLRKLVKVRSTAMEERLKELRVRKKKRGFFSRLSWRAKPPPSCQTLPSPTKNEHNLLNKSLKAVVDIATSPDDEMLVPAGRCLMIIPELHFLEHGVAYKDWIQKGKRTGLLISIDFRSMRPR